MTRVFRSIALPPFAVGVGVAICGFAFYFGVEVLTGEFAAVLQGRAEDHIVLHWRIVTFTVPLLSYLVTAHEYHYRWTEQNLQDLGTLLRPGTRPSSASPKIVAGVIGLLFFVSVALVLPMGLDQLLDRDHWVFEHVWDWFMVPALGWYAGQLAYLMVMDAFRLSRLAADVAEIDLLDLTLLTPFLRQGQQSAMLVAFFMGLAFAHITVPNSRLAFMSIAVLALIVALSSLLLPLRGIHNRIAGAKRTKLTEVRGLMRDAESTLSSERDATADEGDSAALRLPALLALEARIESVPEWLIDRSGFTRSVFYLAIGLGSWLGGAIVERMLDLLLV